MVFSREQSAEKKIVLKHCPWCGGEAGINVDRNGDAYAYCDREKNPHCVVKPYLLGNMSLEAAALAWNTRVTRAEDEAVEQGRFCEGPSELGSRPGGFWP